MGRWLKEILGEREFNRWFIKWRVGDWLLDRATAAGTVVVMSAVAWLYGHHAAWSTGWEYTLLGAFLASAFIFGPTVIVRLFQQIRARKHPTIDPTLVSADEDADIMEQRVHWTRHIEMLPNPQLSLSVPFADFHQQMINASVLPITFEPGIEGRLRINGEEETGILEFRRTPKQALQVERASYHDLAIRQWISPGIAIQIQDRLETTFDFGQVALRFGFQHRGQMGSVGKCLGNQVVWERLPKQPHPIVRLEVCRPDPRAPEGSQLQFKAKLTFVFNNDSGRTIVIQRPGFVARDRVVGDLPILQSPFGYGYQVEHSLGSWRRDRWEGKESSREVQVKPGWDFRLWIGLNPLIPHEQVVTRRETLSLGILSMPITIGSQAIKLEYAV